MTSFRIVTKCGVAGVSLCLAGVMSGCGGHRGGSDYSNAAYTGNPVVTADPDMPMARLRTDITDTGPGTPKGDRTAADPSETSSQGAGSRNLVGQPAGGQATVVQENEAAAPPPVAAPAATAAPQPTLTQNGNDVVIPLYRESAQVGKHEVEAGTVRIHKYVRTETVNQPVQLRQEVVTIEREPARQFAANNASQPFQEQDFTIQLKREEPTVQKEIAPYGAVVARKGYQTEQRTVREQVRRDYVSIDKGNAQGVNISPGVTSLEQGGTATGGSSSVGGEYQGSASGGRNAAVISDLSALNYQTDPASLQGKRVELSNVKVQSVLGSRVIAVSNGDHPIYVLLSEPNRDLQEGATINLHGKVESSQAAEKMARQLSGDSAHVLTQQPFFIKAHSVQIAGR